jgi:hypothetical protein
MLFRNSDLRKLREAGPKGDAAICKVFGGPATWVLFGSEELEGGSERLFGVADIGHGFVEWGTVWRDELESMTGPPWYLSRDKHFSAAGSSLQFFFDYYEENQTLAGC